MNKEEREKSFMRQVIGCLKSPRNSFKSILKKPSLLKATALILVIAIIAAWANYNYTGKLTPSLRPEQGQGPFMGPGSSISPEQIRQASMIISVIIGLIAVFGSWLISSALFHVLSKVQGGKGTFRNMLTLAGYASAPLLIQHLLRLVDSFIVTEKEMLQPILVNVFDQPFLNEIGTAAMNTFNIFVLWAIALFVIAIRENYKISTAKSIVTVAATYIILMFLPL